MKPTSITKMMLIQWGGEEVYRKAEALVRQGRVLSAEFNVGMSYVTGSVRRDNGTISAVRFRLCDHDRIDPECTCFENRKLGIVCQHVIAVGIMVMLRHTDPKREEKYQEECRRARRIAAIDTSLYIQRSPRGRAARLALTFPPTWLTDFDAGSVTISVMFLIGNTCVLPEAITRGQALALSETDDNLLSVLEDICEGPPTSRVTLRASDFLNILDIAQDVALNVAGQGDIHVVPGTFPSGLHIKFNQTTGELHVHAATAIPFATPGETPVHLACGKRGHVYANGQIAKISGVLPEPFQFIYREPETITRPNVMEFLRNTLPQLQTIAHVDMDVAPDMFICVPERPVFHVMLKGREHVLSADLSAHYTEGIVLSAGQPDPAGNFYHPDSDDLLLYRARDLAGEQDALTRLKQAGFVFKDGFYQIVGSRGVLNFLGSERPALERSGWKFHYSDTLEAVLEKLPMIIPVVKIEPVSKQWFDVGYTFDFNGKNVPQNVIQRAINCGDSFLEFSGETLLLDRGAIEAMRAIFEDCHSRSGREAGHFQLPSVYAPFVQSSLNAFDGFDVDDDPAWRANAAARNRDHNATFEPVPLGALESILRPYQKEGVYWLRFLENAGICGLLADEMGLGKTLQTLTWLSLERTDPESRGKPALIVCPTSLVENWNREAEKFVPTLKRVVISGANRSEHFNAIADADLVITSYALIRRDLDDAYATIEFSVMVLDEAQHIKNRSTQNAVAAKQINARTKLVLTGTPVENSVADIWSIMDFLMPGYLDAYPIFRGNYELPIAAGDREGELAQEKLHRKLHPFILRRLKKDVAKDLPDRIVRTVFCAMTEDQQRVYNTVLSASRREIGDLVKAKGFEKSRFAILAILMKLRQVSCTIELLKDHQKLGTFKAPSGKLDAFFELLDEAIDGGHRVLVFSQFVGMLSILKRELDARKLQYCYLDGTTKDRMGQCQRFNQDTSIPLFLISLKAGGTGLNLTGADMVVHFDPWWNPAVEDQATDRAHRIGQKRTVYAIKLIAEHSVEEKVLEMQRRKQAVINATVGATDEAVMQSLTFDDIKGLLDL